MGRGNEAGRQEAIQECTIEGAAVVGNGDAISQGIGGSLCKTHLGYPH